MNARIFATLLGIAALADLGFCQVFYNGVVTHVSDGDTFDMRTTSGQRVTIRLYGVDCPESSQKNGPQAKQFATSMLLNKQVKVQKIGTSETYGRAPGLVTVGGRNFNLELLKAGHGWWYYVYSAGEDEFRDAEATAKSARRGLWSDNRPVAPWTFRDLNKARQLLSYMRA